ncbi:unnamed protein product [Phaeothamnion confervicola]
MYADDLELLKLQLYRFLARGTVRFLLGLQRASVGPPGLFGAGGGGGAGGGSDESDGGGGIKSNGAVGSDVVWGGASSGAPAGAAGAGATPASQFTDPERLYTRRFRALTALSTPPLADYADFQTSIAFPSLTAEELLQDAADAFRACTPVIERARTTAAAAVSRAAAAAAAEKERMAMLARAHVGAPGDEPKLRQTLPEAEGSPVGGADCVATVEELTALAKVGVANGVSLMRVRKALVGNSGGGDIGARRAAKLRFGFGTHYDFPIVTVEWP